VLCLYSFTIKQFIMPNNCNLQYSFTYILQWNKFDNWDSIVVNRYEQFVDAKRVVGSHKSKKGRQCNGQAKKDKMINIGLQKTTQKTEDWAARIPLKSQTELCRWQLESLVWHCMAVPGFLRWSVSLIVQNIWMLPKSVENNLK
jgi:hypothetical protein